MRIGTRALLPLLVLLAAGPVRAQFSVQKFAYSPHARDYLSIHSSEVNEHLVPAAQLLFQFASKPLVFGFGGVSQEVVSGFVGVDALFSIALFERLEIGVDMPIYPYVGGGKGDAIVQVDSFDSFSLGDLKLDAKIVALPHQKKGFGLAVDLGLTAPTATGDSFLGEDGLTFVPKLIAELNLDDLRFALNLGYRLRKNQALTFTASGVDLPVNDELLIGVGAGYALMDKHLYLIGELQTASAATDYFGSDNTSYIEGDLGARYHTDLGLAFSVGGGGGWLAGYGNPQVRMFASVGWVPLKAGPKDEDGDGIVDEQDICPREPEDVDGFQDSEGCPDPDNDADGILDVDDPCPVQAEDKDGFQDEDGCPEPDNDNDGALDADDKCPDTPEDFDSFQDEDGCPDYDNDEDGILDEHDQCRNAAETRNEYMDEDGCPDTAPIVFVTKDKIIISQKIFFKRGTARILGKSAKVLDAVVDILLDHTEITKISVEGHTSTEGSAKKNKRLSERRAKAIVTYLRRKGVEKDRLTHRGWGAEQPITPVPEATDEDREKNRRVEFIILEQGEPEEPPAE